MYRLEVRQASCSHEEQMQKKQHQLGPVSSYINITSTKYLFFLQFPGFPNGASFPILFLRTVSYLPQIFDWAVVFHDVKNIVLIDHRHIYLHIS